MPCIQDAYADEKFRNNGVPKDVTFVISLTKHHVLALTGLQKKNRRVS